MAYPTPIEWTDATWNPVGGCSIKSPGCTHCYAQGLAGTRLHKLPLYAGTTSPSKTGPVFNGHLTASAGDHDVWSWPARWRGARHPKLGPGEPSTIFVGDMADLFHEDRPRADIDRAVAGIIYSPHIGQFLTKRPDVMADYFIELRDSGRWLEFNHPILGKPNFDPVSATWRTVFARCWAMTSIEDQPRADERLPHLLRTPLPVHGVSAEPLLGPIDIRPWLNTMVESEDVSGYPAWTRGIFEPAIDWVITGYESGQQARVRSRSIALSLRDQCRPAAAAFLHKQNGEWIDADEWFDIIQRGGNPIIISPDRAIPWRPERPLNYADAARLAKLTGRGDRYEHQSDGTTLIRVGKKAAGRLLNGRIHDEMPV